MLLLFLLACSCCCSLHVWVSAIVIGTASFLVGWSLLASFFVVCCFLLFDSTLQGFGPAHVIGPFGASWLGCCVLCVLVCLGFAMLGCCIHSWISCYIFLH
jgi:hypothetical protein